MPSSPLRSEKLDLRLTPGAKQNLQQVRAWCSPSAARHRFIGSACRAMGSKEAAITTKATVLTAANMG